ncbi:MAG: hypothetical protein ABIN91_09015 [Mucilaginibacter sp.]|uniref:tetratricopeptide repeat protein n=1 Tax=Mucilaginibacter sp. TaxID=1882438 RepID=UPI003267007F
MSSEEKSKLLEQFYIEYNNENYTAAKELLETIKAQEKKTSFWIYSRLSSCYYELRNYNIAFEYAKKAYKLQPWSPLVLWDYAGVLIMLDKEKRAIELLLRIQSMEDDLTIYGFSHPEIKWMKSFKLDSNFLIGRAYYQINQDRFAKEYLLKYLAQRKQGLRSIYKKADVVKYLKKLEKADS